MSQCGDGIQAGYAIAGLRGEVKTKGRAQISGHYGIPGKGTNVEVQEKIEWLLKNSNFTCGGVDAQVRNMRFPRCVEGNELPGVCRLVPLTAVYHLAILQSGM